MKTKPWQHPRSTGTLAAAMIALLAQIPGTASAFTFSGEYIYNWGSCDSSCSGAGSLSYTDDQVQDFASRMTGLGQTQKHLYGNTAVWASDFTEDGLGGKDYLYTDDSDIVAYSGHGSGPSTSSGQTFQAPFCKAGTTSSCWFDSKNARFGERSGGYSSPYPGNTRWLMWLTCYSVDTAPNEQWGEALWVGLEYVMGYRGTSADSSTTVEVPGDWADQAIGASDTFKAAWFWAIEDWWANDTGAVAASGPDSTASAYRRDNLKKSWARRASTDTGNSVAWAWHEG